ncbi:hypothetical protein C7999DRAFT_44412 [Corynascus novoguineensis]|uniref:Carbohydrate-binding module family 18 protein n=1 Tax=Corynascus novoguineensis TaxID=1126955 RepID=A0AAN7CKM0_9PEZI|nr:hypothetical protein C7999DRAFT_44412 [Corynascus novoguineensis]
MMSLHRNGALRRAVLFLSLVPSFVSAQDQADCQPYRWGSSGLKMRQDDPADPLPTQGTPIPVTVGEINCRYWTTTPAEVNYYTCSRMTQRYDISNDVLFNLNSSLARDCSNVEPETAYCVRGSLRAFDGKYGRPNNNATCLGTDKQCCNSQTWTCGDSEADCAPGRCYEGACDGDLIYSTDRTCGQEYGSRSYAGRWGDCCSIDGRCSTGPAHCGLFTCQEGDCDIWKEDQQPEGTPWAPNGFCGGAEGYRCWPDWGRCCNVNGVCGENPANCYVERGCQPAFGICASNSTTDPTTTSSTTSTSTATSPLPVLTDACRDRVGAGGLAGLCSWTCNPSPASRCCATLRARMRPTTARRGVCTRVPYTTTPGGEGTACVQGVGEGGKAGLCSYSWRFGHCPVASGCTCTLYGQPIAEPPVLGTPGKPAPGITDGGCNHGYCPPEVCVYA